MKTITVEIDRTGRDERFFGEVRCKLPIGISSRADEIINNIRQPDEEYRLGLMEPAEWIDLSGFGQRTVFLEAMVVMNGKGVLIESYDPMTQSFVRSVALPADLVTDSGADNCLYASSAQAAIGIYDSIEGNVDPDLIRAAFEAAEYLGGLQKAGKAMEIIETCRRSMNAMNPFVKMDTFAFIDGSVVGFTNDDDQKMLLQVA